MEALAEESYVDHSRAAKTSSYDATRKSRTRGRRSIGGQIVIRSLGDEQGILMLEEWEVTRIVRLLPPELQACLRPSSDARDQRTAAVIAATVGSAHPHHAFFAATRQGFTVERA